jgi:hypothetical protein
MIRTSLKITNRADKRWSRNGSMSECFRSIYLIVKTNGSDTICIQLNIVFNNENNNLFGLMVLNATFNNMFSYIMAVSFILEETGVPVENKIVILIILGTGIGI